MASVRNQSSVLFEYPNRVFPSQVPLLDDFGEEFNEERSPDQLK